MCKHTTFENWSAYTSTSVSTKRRQERTQSTKAISEPLLMIASVKLMASINSMVLRGTSEAAGCA
eukprot:1161564-Pelagomonas_calceolata.AAC.9